MNGPLVLTATVGIAIVATILVSAVWSIISYDLFVKYLYSEHRTLWERLGSPRGYYWLPGNASAHKWITNSKLSWFGPAPDWLTEYPEAASVYWKTRRIQRNASVILLSGMPLVMLALYLCSIFHRD